ncbi:hypothetical protein Tco_1246758 [Tanacetum coccineum]
MAASLWHKWRDTIYGSVISLRRLLIVGGIRDFRRRIGRPYVYYFDIVVDGGECPTPHPPLLLYVDLQSCVEALVALIDLLYIEETVEVAIMGMGNDGDAPGYYPCLLDKACLSGWQRTLNKLEGDAILVIFWRSKQEMYHQEYKINRQVDGESSTEFLKVANAARNIEILQKEMLDRLKMKTKREPERMNKMRMRHARGNKSITIGIRACYRKQKDNHRKRHPSNTYHKAIGACFTFGAFGHRAKDYKNKDGKGNNEDDKDDIPKNIRRRVFAMTTNQFENA